MTRLWSEPKHRAVTLLAVVFGGPVLVIVIIARLLRDAAASAWHEVRRRCKSE